MSTLDGRRVLPVSLLICTRNRPDGLSEVLASVSAGTALPAEVVVIDQSERPHHDVEGALPTAVVYLHRPGRGLARARNIGFEAAGQDAVVLIDDDMLADTNWLAELVEAQLDAGPGGPVATTGQVLAAPLRPGEHPLPAASLIEIDRPHTFVGRQPRDVVPGAGVCLPRRLVLDMGGYDERLGAGSAFHSAEDNDLGIRLLDAGLEVRHVPTAIARHRGRADATGVRRTQWGYAIGKGALYAKWWRDPQVRRRAGRDVIGRIARLVARGPRDRDLAAREAIALVGIAQGAIRWTIGAQGRRTASRSTIAQNRPG